MSVHRGKGGLQFFWGCGLQFFGGGGWCLQPEYSQRSAGTHPTGMHSCINIYPGQKPIVLSVNSFSEFFCLLVTM